MFRLIKQVFLALFSFSASLATTCKFLKNEPCITRATLIDLNHDELCHHSFMVSLQKCNWGYNNILWMIHQVEYEFQTKTMM